MSRYPDEPSDGYLSEVIPIEYTTLIGEIVSKWALLEHEIDVVLWDMAGLNDTPKIAACLTGQYVSVAARFNALIAIARLRGVSEFQIAKLNKFKEHVLGLAERRNRVAHDPWLANWDFQAKPMRPTATYRLHKTARSKLEYTLKPIELSELQSLKDEIEKILTDFGGLGSIDPPLAPFEVR